MARSTALIWRRGLRKAGAGERMTAPCLGGAIVAERVLSAVRASSSQGTGLLMIDPPGRRGGRVVSKTRSPGRPFRPFEYPRFDKGA